MLEDYTFGVITSHSPSEATTTYLCMSLNSNRITSGRAITPNSLKKWSPNALLTAKTPATRSYKTLPPAFLKNNNIFIKLSYIHNDKLFN